MELTYPKKKIDYLTLEKQSSLFSGNLRQNSVYHYTSIGGLKGILSNQTLHFTNIKYMNDKDEYIAGLDSLAKVYGFSSEEHAKIKSVLTSQKVQTFVCCFSLKKDSLPMWNYYTKEINNQGYNIEFDDKKLVESILRNNPCLDGCEISFGKVDYSKDNDSEYSIAIANEIISSFKVLGLRLQTLFEKNICNAASSTPNKETLEKTISNIEKKKNRVPIFFYNGEKCRFEKNPSENYLYFIKRDCFRQEKEFRIVISVPDELLPKLTDKKVYKFRISNGVLVPYLELKFSKEVVKSLTISPTVKSDLVEQSIQDFIKYSGYNIEDFSKFIKHSEIPVRF